MNDTQGRPARAATLRGMAWMVLAGFLFCLLNTIARSLAQTLDPFQTQFLRYSAGLLVLLPFMMRTGLAPGGRTTWSARAGAGWCIPPASCSGSGPCRRCRSPT